MMQKNKGFTLIEILVVMGVIAIILPALIGAFINVMREYTKAYAMKTVLENSTNAIETLRTTFKKYSKRTLKKICSDQNCNTEICLNSNSSNLTKIYFQYVDDNESATPELFGIKYESEKIMLYENTNLDLIDSSKVKIDNFTINCTLQSNNSMALIEINFTTTFKPKADQASKEESASLPFYVLFKVNRKVATQQLQN